MAAFEPFEPAVKSGTTGFTIALTAGAGGTSNSTTLSSTGLMNPSLMVTNPNAFTVFVRMSAEATPTATSADTPMLASSVRLFANPSPGGVSGFAIIASITTAPIYFTPGEGGI